MFSCTALLLAITVCAVSPAFAAESKSNKSERLARIKIESDSSYVSMKDNSLNTKPDFFEIPNDAEIGEQYISGDMIIEIVSKNDIERVVAEE